VKHCLLQCAPTYRGTQRHREKHCVGLLTLAKHLNREKKMIHNREYQEVI
jgi:hypothetical protein